MPSLPQVVNQQTVSYQNIRVGQGNPNDIEQYGEKGWIYQDWDGGGLYVCASAGIGSWNQVSAGGPVIPYGTGEGQVLQWNGSVWDNRDFLGDANNAVSANVINRILVDSTGATAAGWEARRLYFEDQTMSVGWQSCELQASEVISLNWSTRSLNDIDGFLSLDWGLGAMYDSLHDVTFDWFNRYLFKQWTTLASGKTSGNIMSNAQYLPTTNTGGTYNPAAPANAGMVILHQAASAALIASMTLQLHGATSAIDSVPVGGDISFTSRYGVTALTVTYGTHVLLGTAVTTCAAGATITWRKLAVIGGSTYIARLT